MQTSFERMYRLLRVAVFSFTRGSCSCRSGIAKFHGSFVFNRKRNIVELDIKQDMSRGTVKYLVSETVKNRVCGGDSFSETDQFPCSQCFSISFAQQPLSNNSEVRNVRPNQWPYMHVAYSWNNLIDEARTAPDLNALNEISYFDFEHHLLPFSWLVAFRIRPRPQALTLIFILMANNNNTAGAGGWPGPSDVWIGQHRLIMINMSPLTST